MTSQFCGVFGAHKEVVMSTSGSYLVSLNSTLQFSVRAFDMVVHKCMRRWVGHAAWQWASPSMPWRFGFVPLFQMTPRAWLQLLSSVELVLCHFFLSPLQAGETLTRKVKSAWAVVRFNPPNSWRHAFFKHFWALKEGAERNGRIMYICLLVIRCISSLSFYLMIGFYSEGQYFWSVMILHSGDLKGAGNEGDEKKKPPSFCGFEQPLICTKFRFALLFRDQRLTRTYYSIITGMLNQQNAIVKVLTGGFHLRKRGLEAFRVMPFVQLCILNLLGISCQWDFMFCVAELHVCMCVLGSFSLTHTHILACKSIHAQVHTLVVSSISAAKPDPPRLFSLVVMSKFAQEGRGKGRAMRTCVGVFYFFFLTKCTSDYQRSPTPEIQITYWSLLSSKPFSSFV